MCERRPGEDKEGGEIRVKIGYQSLDPKLLFLVMSIFFSTGFPFFMGFNFCVFFVWVRPESLQFSFPY